MEINKCALVSRAQEFIVIYRQARIRALRPPVGLGTLRPLRLKRPAAKRKNPNEKLFGRYDELVRMFLGFLLTGILGAYLSHRYTTQQADLTAAGKVFSEHSKLIGDRYFAQAQLTDALKKRAHLDPPDSANLVEKRLDGYRQILQDWNSARGYNREMIKLYFGERTWSVERDVHYAFRAWGQALEAELVKPGSVDFACLTDKSDRLLESTHYLRVSMAEAMQHGLVGADRDMTHVQRKPTEGPNCLTAGSSASR